MRMSYFMRSLFIALHLLIAVAFTAGCGKKAPPLPPIIEGNAIAAPYNLKYTVTGDTLKLSWEHQTNEETARVKPDSFELFEAVKTFDDCEGCPFKFSLLKEIPSSNFTYTYQIKKGYRYYFRVQAVNDDGKRSEYSKTVQYEYR